MTTSFTLKWNHHPSLNDSRIEGAPQRGNKRTAQGRAKRHPGYETHTKTRPTGAKAFCTRQRKTMSLGYIRFCPCRANSLSFLFPGRCPGLCACASPRRLSTHHHFLIHNYGFNPRKSARSAFIRVPSPRRRAKKKICGHLLHLASSACHVTWRETEPFLTDNQQ